MPAESTCSVVPLHSTSTSMSSDTENRGGLERPTVVSFSSRKSAVNVNMNFNGGSGSNRGSTLLSFETPLKASILDQSISNTQSKSNILSESIKSCHSVSTVRCAVSTDFDGGVEKCHGLPPYSNISDEITPTEFLKSPNQTESKPQTEADRPGLIAGLLRFFLKGKQSEELVSSKMIENEEFELHTSAHNEGPSGGSCSTFPTTINIGNERILEPFQCDQKEVECFEVRSRELGDESAWGSPKRAEGSASPLGSFYFAGDSQVYIPDAPEDIMDIPSNQSFAGGGSFCSSPVVISKRLKTVDVSHNLQVLNDKYVVYMDKLIGSGSFGEVHLCYSTDEEIYYAVKVLDRRRLERMGIGTGNNGMEKLLNEIAIMQRLRHDNIIALKEVINDGDANTIYLILELAGYGPLIKLQGGFVEPDCEGNTRIDERTVQELVQSMVQALVYAHHEGVAHRDIKPDNILLTSDSQLKVSDFGVSCLVDKQRTLDREGSIAFLPPEMLLPITKEKFIAPSPHISSSSASQIGSNDSAHCVVSEEQAASEHVLRISSATESFPALSIGTSNNLNPRNRESPKDSRNNRVGWQAVNRNEIDLFKADVWSLGVTTFVMLHGHLPWLAHVDPIQIERAPYDQLTIENFITRYLDPQSRFRLALYERWKIRQEEIGDLHLKSADHSYVSPYRLGNSFSKKPDAEITVGNCFCDSSICEKGARDSLDTDDVKSVDKEDKQNVEFAFWRYWCSLVQESGLDSHTPASATEKQLRAILCSPDPAGLFHASTSIDPATSVPKSHSWEVFVSSDDESDAENDSGAIIDFPKRTLSNEPGESGSFDLFRQRTKNTRLVGNIENYFFRQKNKFDERVGPCSTCSPHAISFLRACLQIDPVVRPTMKDLLQHPWLASAKALYERRCLEQKETISKLDEHLFSDIPLVNEEVRNLTSMIEKENLPLSNSRESGHTRSRAPTQTSARPIERDEFVHLPKNLPLLFDNVSNKAGLLKASMGKVVFSSLFNGKRCATDDSLLLELRQKRLSEAREFRWEKLRACKVKVRGLDGVSSCRLEDATLFQSPSSPLKEFLTKSKASIPIRSLSLPSHLDELEANRVVDFSSSSLGEGRKRTNTMAPAYVSPLKAIDREETE